MGGGLMSLEDRCPDCVSATYARPVMVVEATTGSGVVANYSCPRRHLWWTSWNVPLWQVADAA